MFSTHTGYGFGTMPLLAWALALAGGFALTQPANAQSFAALDPLGPGLSSSATGVSADGAVTVGWGDNGSNTQAIRWDATGAAEALSSLVPGGYSFAYAASADGLVVVGSGFDGAFRAVRWDAAGAATALDFLVAGGNSYAYAVSADGLVAVGAAYNGTTTQAIRWDANGDAHALALWAGDNAARGVSADGAVAVGGGRNGTITQAIRWDASGAAEALDWSSGDSYAYAVSADGAVAVGYAFDGSITQAVRWDAAGAAEVLDSLVAGFDSFARAVSADGSVIVGKSESPDGDTAVRWTEPGGVRSIAAILAGNGVDLGGWSLEDATGVSADGTTIVGRGLNPGGVDQAWITRDMGLITVSGATQSLASLGYVAEGATSFLGGLLRTQQEYALQQAAYTPPPEPPALGYAAEPAFDFPGVKPGPGAEPRRWRVFGYAEAGGRSEPDGAVGTGQIGASYLLAPYTVTGASLGFGGAGTDLAFEGKSDLLGASGSAFIAYVPPSGPQAVASVTAAGLDVDIARGYENGAGLAQSHGETDGTGFGGSLRLGWAFVLTERVTLTPFGDYQATRVKFDGYTETDGPFPAMIGAIDDTAQISRLGMEGRYALSDLSWLWAGAAWGHRIDGNSAAIDAQLIGLFGVGGASFALDHDWAELTGGVSYGLDDRSRLTASATAFVSGEDSAAASGRIGYSRAF